MLGKRFQRFDNAIGGARLIVIYAAFVNLCCFWQLSQLLTNFFAIVNCYMGNMRLRWDIFVWELCVRYDNNTLLSVLGQVLALPLAQQGWSWLMRLLSFCAEWFWRNLGRMYSCEMGVGPDNLTWPAGDELSDVWHKVLDFCQKLKINSTFKLALGVSFLLDIHCKICGIWAMCGYIMFFVWVATSCFKGVIKH